MPFVNLLDVIYPIGSLYISFSSISPAEIIGGQWEPIIGRFPYFSDKIETGGENTHTLTVSEMPNHQHDVHYREHNSTSGMSGWSARTVNELYQYELHGYTSNVGGGQPHNNMPAYQSMYAWRRVA